MFKKDSRVFDDITIEVGACVCTHKAANPSQHTHLGAWRRAMKGGRLVNRIVNRIVSMKCTPAMLKPR